MYKKLSNWIDLTQFELDGHIALDKRGWRDTWLWLPEQQRYVRTGSMLNRVLKKELHTTYQDWYDKNILCINNVDERPVCCNCGKPVEFRGIYGYADTCSVSCHAQLNKFKPEVTAKVKRTKKENFNKLTPQEQLEWKQWYSERCKHSEESNRKNAESVRRAFQRPETKHKQHIGLINAFKRPEVKENIRKARIRFWRGNDETSPALIRKPNYRFRAGHLENAQYCLNKAYYRSSYERNVFELLEQLQWYYKVEPYRMTFNDNNVITCYVPDLEVQIPNLGNVLIEVKPANRLYKERRVWLKTYAAYQFIKRGFKNCKAFVIITEADFENIETFKQAIYKQINYHKLIDNEEAYNIPWASCIINSDVRQSLQLYL